MWLGSTINDAEELNRLRAEIARPLKDRDMAYSLEIEALVAHKHKLEAEVERLRAVLEPLLDHYLNCYDGNEDDLAKRARKALTAAKHTGG